MINKDFLCPNVSYDMPPRQCYSSDSMEKIQRDCNQKSSCIYEGQNGFDVDSGFVNVCPGLTSSLFVQWTCLPNTTISSTTQSTNTTSEPTLPTCPYNITQNIDDNCTSNFSSSPYEPSPLINSTQTYFGYPISQQIVCHGSRLIILCPLDLVINIFSAYYGIQLTTMSSTCVSSTSTETPTKCYVPNALESIRATCQSERSCQLRATANNLGGGDFCPSYSKQLLVQYQCIHPTVLNTTMKKCNQIKPNVPFMCNTTTNSEIQSSTWCDGSSVTITCPSGRSIRIVCAFYGVHPSVNACNVVTLVNSPVCYFASSASLLAASCDGRSTCSIDQLSSKFTPDPCVGLDKALFVQWRCV